MENRINIAELLKDCPKDMELDCTVFDNVTFETICEKDTDFPIRIKYGNDGMWRLSKYGCETLDKYAKCVIFPKGKTTWEGFQRPFKDGDIVFTNQGSIAIIYHKEGLNPEYISFCGLFPNKFDKDVLVIPKRLATEEEKQKLFDAIKENGYKWNAETKTLERLNPFKAGDVLESMSGNIVLCDFIDDKQVVHYHCILEPFGSFIIRRAVGVGKSSNCTLAADAQKQRLFDKLKSSGYRYNPEKNILEKLIGPKFKVWDKIEKCGYRFTIKEVREYHYLTKCGNLIAIANQDDFSLVPNKFDITTLNTFDKVLARCSSLEKWHIHFFEKYDKTCKFPFTCMGHNKYKQCIPYEGNQHLLDTTNDCDEFYKTWE